MEAALAGEMSAGPNYRGEKPRTTLISSGMWTQRPNPGSGIIRRAWGAGENRRRPAVASKRPARAGICAGGGGGGTRARTATLQISFFHSRITAEEDLAHRYIKLRPTQIFPEGVAKVPT